MKLYRKIFSWVFGVLFLLVSLMLSGEFAGVKYHDTSLFPLGGKSVGLQGVIGRPLVDLDPTFMRICWGISAAGSLHC